MGILPAISPPFLISRPVPRMSESAKRLLVLRSWLQTCIESGRRDDEAYLTECRLREQAALLIGYGA